MSRLYLSTQNGTTDTDEVLDVEDALNNTFVLVGRSSGDWDGANAGSADMAAMKLDIDGNLLWKWQVGALRQNSNRPAALEVSDRVAQNE
ncbi:unnamed protein product [Laminaria digitata]